LIQVSYPVGAGLCWSAGGVVGVVVRWASERIVGNVQQVLCAVIWDLKK